MRLENKVAVITGGGTGIGRACAQALHREGAKVVIFGRRKEPLDKVARALGKNALAIPGDITDEKDLERLVQTTISQWQKIDILVNNAGVFTAKPTHQVEDDQWDAVIDVNLRAVFRLTRMALRHMAGRRTGNIINISSILGLVAMPQAAAYNASKGALNLFTRTVAVEYGAMGIRCNAICPGLIATEMTEEMMKNKELLDEWIKDYPIGRFGAPEDIANACLFLASEESAFITGVLLPVDGGCTAAS
jgi:NAD(P)-dependent dehydrogenase (short-subunit alcohol dehydrogenase family)